MFFKSQYSLKYGILKPEEIVDWALAHHYSLFALTDINSSGAVMQYAKLTQQHNIPTCAGVEIRNDMQKCFTIMAKNNRGLHEANEFLSTHLHHNIPFPATAPFFNNCYVIYPFENRPPLLQENEWIGIDTSQINQLNMDGHLQDVSKILAFQSMTFRNKQDFNTHRLLRAIHNNVLLSKLKKTQQAPETEYFISYPALQQKFEPIKKILKNTEHVLSNCRLHFEFEEKAKPQNPYSYTGSKSEDLQLLKKLAKEGIKYRYPETTPQITERIDKEIEVIEKKDYLSYFLITWDFTSYARSKGYFYVGRGSGANSIVAYLLRITDVDPLELDLYFERFINLYRSNPPDFDIDFSWRDRDDVTAYIFNRYPNVALLCTYNTFQYKATVRELGKVFGLPKSEIDQLSKSKHSNKTNDHLHQLVLKYSQYIQGLPSHLSVHAGGIVISEKPITWFSASFLPPKGYPTTQFSMLEAEDVGLFKFDVLSQRGLGKIQDTLKIISYNQKHNPPIDIHNIQAFKTDPKIKSILRQAKAMGCFYIESPAMRMLLLKLQVDSYLGLVAASSIIRPGVAQSGMMRAYIERHHYTNRRKEAHPVLLELMPETYGVMVYQEDVIKVAHHFAGLSLAQSDVLRRGMSGKSRGSESFERIKRSFYENCKEKKYAIDLIESIWKQIESFAGYAFSKGHSASYAVESYQSLYLKTYYPLEYMTAVINNFGGYYRTEIYIHEARTLGAQIEAPCINYGDFECILRNKILYLGFNLVNGIESRLIEKIISERKKNGSFKSFDDLVKRIFVPLEQLILMIRIGALRTLSESRKELLWKAHFFHHSNKNKSPSLTLFEIESKPISFPLLEEKEHELAFEQMELLGFPLCNPFDLLAQTSHNHFTTRMMNQFINEHVCILGYLVALKISYTVHKEPMYFGTFYDSEGELFDTVHFPPIAKAFPFLGKGIYALEGKICQEHGYQSIEIKKMTKIPFIEDVRYHEDTLEGINRLRTE